LQRVARADACAFTAESVIWVLSGIF
jgi:hypothetical protein